MSPAERARHLLALGRIRRDLAVVLEAHTQALLRDDIRWAREYRAQANQYRDIWSRRYRALRGDSWWTPMAETLCGRDAYTCSCVRCTGLSPAIARPHWTDDSEIGERTTS